jgi:predicted small integral membrane protein
MTLRLAKISLVFAAALYYFVIVFNNVTDYDSDYQFVRHVLMMDTTFPGNHLMWRAINAPAIHTAFYLSIIAWEALSMILCFAGGLKLTGALRDTATAFNAAKRLAIIALTLSLLQWLLAFLIVGGEWFLMWQSRTWNGQDAALRMFIVIGIPLLFLTQPDTEEQP